MGQGGVAVEDLDDEPAEDGDGGQQAVAPAMAGAAAGVMDGGLVEARGEVLPEAAQGGENPVVHRGASGTKVSFKHHQRDGRAPDAQVVKRPGLGVSLMAFGIISG